MSHHRGQSIALSAVLPSWSLSQLITLSISTCSLPLLLPHTPLSCSELSTPDARVSVYLPSSPLFTFHFSSLHPFSILFPHFHQSLSFTVCVGLHNIYPRENSRFKCLNNSSFSLSLTLKIYPNPTLDTVKADFLYYYKLMILLIQKIHLYNNL